MISRCGRAAGALAHRHRGAGDRPHLHLVDLGLHHAEPHAAGAEHRVGLLERAHPIELALEDGQARAAVDPRAHDLLVQLEAVGQELVQRRVEQANRHRPSDHRLEQALEVALLEREQLVQRGLPAGVVLGHDHRPHLRLAIGGHEHVLGPAQPDPLGAEAVRAGGVLGRVGVRPHADLPQLVGPAQDGLEPGVDVGLDQRHVVGRDQAVGAVDRDEVAPVQDEVADPHLAQLEIDVERRPRRSPPDGPCRGPPAPRARPCRPPR